MVSPYRRSCWSFSTLVENVGPESITTFWSKVQEQPFVKRSISEVADKYG